MTAKTNNRKSLQQNKQQQERGQEQITAKTPAKQAWRPSGAATEGYTPHEVGAPRGVGPADRPMYLGDPPPLRGAAKFIVFIGLRLFNSRKYVIQKGVKVKFVFLKELAVS
jgi:hypothetical protein